MSFCILNVEISREFAEDICKIAALVLSNIREEKGIREWVDGVVVVDPLKGILEHDLFTGTEEQRVLEEIKSQGYWLFEAMGRTDSRILFWKGERTPTKIALPTRSTLTNVVAGTRLYEPFHKEEAAKVMIFREVGYGIQESKTSSDQLFNIKF